MSKQLVLRLDGPDILATFVDGQSIRHHDAQSLAELLWAAGVRAEDVNTVDWHGDVDQALMAGQKIAILSYLRQRQMDKFP